METLDFEAFEMIALEKGCDIAFPLKEKMLIEAVKQIMARFHSEEGALLFGGGTSLVCAFDELTKRFSEDADFRFYPKPKSTKLLREELTDLMCSLDGFRLIEQPHSDSRKIEFHLEDSAQIVRRHSSLRPYIKVEFFFADNLWYAPVEKALMSGYSKMKGCEPEATVACVSLEDTAIDKLCSFLWRIYAHESSGSHYHPSDMRHLSDLAFLSRRIQLDDVFGRAFHVAFKADMASRLHQDATFENVANRVLQVMADSSQYEKDFAGYVSNMSYAKTSESIGYAEAMDVFQSIVKRLIAFAALTP